jgi:hypothetical protein
VGIARGSMDCEWARQVVDRALEAMKKGCVRSSREDLWRVFEGRAARAITTDKEGCYGLAEFFGLVVLGVS